MVAANDSARQECADIPSACLHAGRILCREAWRYIAALEKGHDLRVVVRSTLRDIACQLLPVRSLEADRKQTARARHHIPSRLPIHSLCHVATRATFPLAQKSPLRPGLGDGHGRFRCDVTSNSERSDFHKTRDPAMDSQIGRAHV